VNDITQLSGTYALAFLETNAHQTYPGKHIKVRFLRCINVGDSIMEIELHTSLDTDRHLWDNVGNIYEIQIKPTQNPRARGQSGSMK
jgi:hypothetical protein